MERHGSTKRSGRPSRSPDSQWRSHVSVRPPDVPCAKTRACRGARRHGLLLWPCRLRLPWPKLALILRSLAIPFTILLLAAPDCQIAQVGTQGIPDKRRPILVHLPRGTIRGLRELGIEDNLNRLHTVDKSPHPNPHHAPMSEVTRPRPVDEATGSLCRARRRAGLRWPPAGWRGGRARFRGRGWQRRGLP